MQKGSQFRGHYLGEPVAAGAALQALAGGDVAVADAEGFAEAAVGGDGSVELLQALLDRVVTIGLVVGAGSRGERQQGLRLPGSDLLPRGEGP